MIQARQLTQRGMDAAFRGNWEQAEADFGNAAQLSAHDVPARYHYATALWRRGDRSEAIAVMAEAVRLSGSDPGLHAELGEMYLGVGDLPEAEWHAEVAIRGNTRLAPAWALRGDVLRRRNDAAGALAAYHRALSHQEDFPRVQLEVADLYRAQNRPRRALATLDRLAQSYPQDEIPPEVLHRQGLALLALERHEDAVDHLAAAVERGANSADAFYHLGRAELLAGRPTSARWAAGRALALAPQHHGAQDLIVQIDATRERMAAATRSPVMQ